MSKARPSFFVYVAAVVTGVSIGWLAGLSMSPVAQATLTSLLALVAAAAGLAAGKPASEHPGPKDTKDANGKNGGEGRGERARLILVDSRAMYLVTALIVGVAAGSPLGIVARTHNVFGVSVGHDTVAGRPNPDEKKKEDKTPGADPRIGGMFANERGEICSTLGTYHGQDLVDNAHASADRIIQIVTRCASTEVEVRDVLALICK